MKKFIKYILNTVPRPVIQRFVHIVTPVAGLFYTGRKVECPICGSRYRKFMPYGYVTPRENALCPHCLSLERHRLMWLYLNNETTFFKDKPRLLHIAPERCFMKRLERLLGEDYVTADLESPLAKVKVDIQQIPFANGSFDVVFCNHILEHVEDDRRAMREVWRVLKPGGWGIMMCPVTKGLVVTKEDPTITTPEGRFVAFGQKDHVREYGEDYASRLREEGFTVEENDYTLNFTPEERYRYGIPGDMVYIVRKED